MHEPDVARRRAAMQQLLRIPGVVRVGYGFKQTAGQLTGEHAYRVYVANKRPLDQVAPDERIPAQLDGVATDVLVADVRRPMTKTPSISAGDKISRFIPNDSQASGTLGAIVRVGADRYILTNQHVLDDTMNLFDGAYDVYDPHLKTCAGIHCNHPVAQVKGNSGVRAMRTEADGNAYFVDCALAKLGSDVTATNRLAGIGALDQGARDLSLEVGTSVRVQKHGARTGTSVGTVIEWHAHNGPNEEFPDVEDWSLRVHPSPGATFSGSWTLDPATDQNAKLAAFAGATVHLTISNDGDDKTLHASGTTMADEGDSGSIVVDDQRRVVGLLWASYAVAFDVLIDDEPRTVRIPLGDASVSYFFPVCRALGLDPQTAIIPPAAFSAGAAVELPLPAQDDLQRLEALAAETPLGRRLIALLSVHYAELAHLVHHRRRVTVTWHRSHGPAFVAAALHATRGRDAALPGSLVDALARMRAAIAAEGSPALVAAIDTEADAILRVAARATSVSSLLAALRDDA